MVSPAEREAEQLQPRPPPARAPVGRIAGVGEQAPHVHVVAPRQGGPHHLVPKAGDCCGVGAGEGQHGAHGVGPGQCGLEQQGLLVQGRGWAEGFILQGRGGLPASSGTLLCSAVSPGCDRSAGQPMV